MEYVEGQTLAQVLRRLKEAAPETETPFGAQSGQQFYFNIAQSFFHLQPAGGLEAPLGAGPR